MPPFTVKKGDLLYWVSSVDVDARGPEGGPYGVVAREVVASGDTQFRLAFGNTWRGYHLRMLGDHFHQTPRAAIQAFEQECLARIEKAKEDLQRAEAGVAWAKKQAK